MTRHLLSARVLRLHLLGYMAVAVVVVTVVAVVVAVVVVVLERRAQVAPLAPATTTLTDMGFFSSQRGLRLGEVVVVVVVRCTGSEHYSQKGHGIRFNTQCFKTQADARTHWTNFKCIPADLHTFPRYCHRRRNILPESALFAAPGRGMTNHGSAGSQEEYY
jgi:hypothetical protein